MDNKIKTVENMLKDIDIKKNLHLKKYIKYKNIDNISKISVSILNGVSISSIILAIGPQLPFLLILTLCSTSVAGLIGIIHQAASISHKLNAHHITYHQYVDLLRDIKGKILRNHLISKDYDDMIININIRLTIIEDNELI